MGVSDKEGLRVLGLTVQQLLIIAAVGVALVVLLFVLRTLFRLTKAVLRFGCLGVVIILAIIFVAMQAFGA
jgi:hypothetical protein